MQRKYSYVIIVYYKGKISHTYCRDVLKVAKELSDKIDREGGYTHCYSKMKKILFSEKNKYMIFNW